MDSKASPERSVDLWFEGGNLVIRAEDTVFKVLAAQLSVTSSVFKDMLDVPQPDASLAETYEGIPFVFLPDSAFDVGQLLKAMLYLGCVLIHRRLNAGWD
jgi:hypothetical protein